jgi:DMSO reductase family type II enzyme heme b subunit
MRWRIEYLVLSLIAAGCGEQTAKGPPPAAEVIAKKLSGELPKSDPGAAAWNKAPEHIAKLMIQDQAPPKLDTPSIESLRVRALHDGKWVVFRLEWDDPAAEGVVGPARFGDMAAVQLPAEAGASVPDAAMGQSGRVVRIHLWKAANEARLAGGPDAVARLYPNATVDHYPGHAAPALSAKNLVTSGRPDSPTEDLLAEGFGSLTAAPDQVSLGKGVHANGRWTVTIARPLDQRETEPLIPGGRSYAAFAVWQGSAGNVGSRKMRSGWIPLSIEGVEGSK